MIKMIRCLVLIFVSCFVVPWSSYAKENVKQASHPVMKVLSVQREDVTDAQLAELEKIPLESIWGKLKNLGYNNYFAGLKATQPGKRVVGRALTIRYLPRRPDLESALKTLADQGDWSMHFHVRAAEEGRPGDVIVADMGGGIKEGVFFGDIAALGAQKAGVRGAVIYGASRDLAELQKMNDFSVFAVGFDPSSAAQRGVDWNVPIRIGDAVVLPGDIVVAEEEAVLFFPPELAGEIIESSKKTMKKEEFERKLVEEKEYRFRDIKTMSPEVRKRMEKDAK